MLNTDRGRELPTLESPSAVNPIKTRTHILNTIIKAASSGTSPFDSIRHTDQESSIEFWFARELMRLLGYIKWQKFQDAIDRAIVSCENGGVLKAAHFNHLPGRVSGNGRLGDDWKLSRYACYLIAQNSDPRKIARCSIRRS